MSQRHPTTEAELIELVRSIDVRAPEELHRHAEALVAAHAPRRRLPGAAALPPRGWRLGGAGALVAAAALALALTLGSPGNGASELTVSEASALTLRAATLAAPAESPRARAQLAAAVDGVAFPYWEGHLGWRSTGARVDRIAGRTVRTIFYSNGTGERIGYAIVSGTPAPALSGGVLRWHAGTPYRLMLEHGSQVVAWLREGHLCVVAGRGVSGDTLLRLASWGDHAAAQRTAAR